MDGYTASIDYREFIGNAIVNASISYREVLSDRNDITPAIVNSEVTIHTPFTLAEMPFRYFGQWRHQNNLDTLASQDYFTIGNRYNVRTGTDSSGLSAERGWFIRNDLEILAGSP